MTERDKELGRAVARVPVPPVSGDYWEQVRTSFLAHGRRRAAGADVAFAAGWLAFGLGQLTAWVPSLAPWVGGFLAGLGLLAGGIALLAGAVGALRKGRVPLGAGAAAIGAGRLGLALNALAASHVVVTEAGRLVIGAGAVALGIGLLRVSLDWLGGRSAAGAPPASRVGGLAGAASLGLFGVAVLTRGLGLAAYETGWLVQWAGLRPPWTSRQLDQFFGRGLGPLAWAGTAAAVLGLGALVVRILVSKDRRYVQGRTARDIGGFVLALSWLALEVKALLHGDWLPFGAGWLDVAAPRVGIVNPAVLFMALGALGVGIGWFAVASGTPRKPPRPLPLQACGLLVALPALVAASPPWGGFPASTYMRELAERGEIVIGVKSDIPQLGYHNPVTGRWEGFDVALGQLVAKRLGVRARFVEVTSHDRIPLLEAGRVDLLIATMTIKEDRRRDIDFSYPYYQAHQRLLVPASSRITGYRDLDARRASVCAVYGADSGQTIHALAPDARLVLARDYSQCLDRLERGTVQAITTDDVILHALNSRSPGFSRIVGEPLTVEPWGMAVSKGHPELLDIVNEAIRGIKDDGTWKTLHEHWIAPVTQQGGRPPADGQQFEILVRPAEPSAWPCVGCPTAP